MGKKRERGVLVSVIKQDGGLRLSLDDVVRESGQSPIWKQVEHYTSKSISESTLEDLHFTDKELADFGYQIIARLYAFRQLGES